MTSTRERELNLVLKALEDIEVHGRGEEEMAAVLQAAAHPTASSADAEAESDAEFLARMEAEDAAAFASAVASWRAERQAGRGEARIVEAGGLFAAQPAEQAQAAEDPVLFGDLRRSAFIGKPVGFMDEQLKAYFARQR